MEKQLAVIGLGRFGASVALEATAIGIDVLAVDRDARNVDELKDQVAHAVRADATDRQALEQLGFKGFPAAVVAVGSNELANIMITMNLVQLEVQTVIGRAASTLHASILERLGATQVVSPERDMGARLAHTYDLAHVEYLELTRDHGINKILVGEYWDGMAIEATELARIHDMSVLLLVRDREILVNPGPDLSLRTGDSLVLVGKDQDLRRVRGLKQEQTVAPQPSGR